MKVVVKSEEELIKVATEAIHILACLRKSQKLWGEHYGSYYRQIKNNWEGKADTFLEGLNITEHITKSQIKIEINNEITS